MLRAVLKMFPVTYFCPICQRVSLFLFKDRKTGKTTNKYQSSQDISGEEEFTLTTLKKGESAVVKRLVTHESKNLQKFLAMGILPGRIVRVLQRYPAYIVEVDRTRVAMDQELARGIVIQR